MYNDTRSTQKIWVYAGFDREKGVALFETRYHKVNDFRVEEFDRSAYFNVISNADGTTSYPMQTAEATLEYLKTVDTWEDLHKQGRADNPHQPMLPAATKQQALQILNMYAPPVAAAVQERSEPQLKAA